MQIPEDIVVLIEKYQAGKLTPQEKALLNEWYHSFDDSRVELTPGNNETEQDLEARIRGRLLETIRVEQETGAAKKRFAWLMPAAAAVALVLLSAGAYFLFAPERPAPGIANTIRATDIPAGGNKALLTLANGSTIVLDSASNGTVSLQGNMKVQKLNNGMVAYIAIGQHSSGTGKTAFNTISTPRGGQYHITLSDGTKVWLNASSSIRFPVAFTGVERAVTITGEAYLEVAKNNTMPFKVRAASSEIEVLGTHFNINAYDDEESIKTTLLEGMVKVSVPSTAGRSQVLKPGQQSQVTKAGGIHVVDDADIEEAVAWKNGRFQFKSADLKTILRQISRWYDADIVYKGDVQLHFTGQLPRNQNVSKIFELLSLTGEVHFTIEDQKIIVSP